MRVFRIALLAGTLAACARTGGLPIPVRGDVAQLEGQWIGEYFSVESGRQGSIVFTLRANHDTAFGDVIMIPAEMVARPFEMGADSTSRPPRHQPEMLAIHFVEITGNQLIGDLKAYRDPACGCELATTFIGKLSGNRIEGTFLSYHVQDQMTLTGTWSATRTRGR